MTEGAHASNMPWDWLTGLLGSKRITSRSPSCHHWLHIHLKSHICRSLCGRISFARGTNHPKVVPVYKVQGGNTDHTLKYIKVERMVLKTSKSLCCDLTSLSWEHLFILKEKWWIKKVNWRILKTFALQSSGVFFFFFPFSERLYNSGEDRSKPAATVPLTMLRGTPSALMRQCHAKARRWPLYIGHCPSQDGAGDISRGLVDSMFVELLKEP